MSDDANKNTGHGHVYPRPDGDRARCGGPAFCKECALDAARKQSDESGAPGERECRAFCPPEFTGRWRDWHRGSGCSLDDGQPRTPDGDREIAALGVDHPRST